MWFTGHGQRRQAVSRWRPPHSDPATENEKGVRWETKIRGHYLRATAFYPFHHWTTDLQSTVYKLVQYNCLWLIKLTTPVVLVLAAFLLQRCLNWLCCKILPSVLISLMWEWGVKLALMCIQALPKYLSLWEAWESNYQCIVHATLTTSYLIRVVSCWPFTRCLPILERQIRSSPWERNFVFPLCFLVLLGMTVMALFIVTANTLKLLYHQASVISVQVSTVIQLASLVYRLYCFIFWLHLWFSMNKSPWYEYEWES